MHYGRYIVYVAGAGALTNYKQHNMDMAGWVVTPSGGYWSQHSMLGGNLNAGVK